MDRREFLKYLGLGAAVVVTPKIIFDMGKNSRIYRMADLPSVEYRLERLLREPWTMTHENVYSPNCLYLKNLEIKLA